jgi:hypothetical protein
MLPCNLESFARLLYAAIPVQQSPLSVDYDDLEENDVSESGRGLFRQDFGD